MKPIEVKVARIGNSRGVRIPAPILERYHIGATVLMEERSEGILLRPRGSSRSVLSWDETAREMAAEAEDWSGWDATLADGLETIPWEGSKARSIAEPRSRYTPRRRRKK
ncbi:MAG TPA: AbrB/MazE/SpoVT family DNA-binding domain-containing protein [Gemmatimonadaceae bacterium]